ncbi:MAG: hypothetical protein JSR42_12030 [Proteobacteria bacterium]|nr:hypothetical protein [Pseudomonadota bacterium]
MTDLNDFAIARALHLLAIVLWIGGVAFVTLVLLPACRGLPDNRQQLELFEALEHRFAAIARWSVLLAGLSGLWLTSRLDAWSRFTDPLQWWWMHGTVAVWTILAVMLYILEPLVLHRVFRARAQRDPVGTMALILRVHRILLAASLAVVIGAAAGSHGGWRFG